MGLLLVRRSVIAGFTDSDGEGEVIEGGAEPVTARSLGGDLVMAAAEVLHEGMVGSQDPGGAVALQPICSAA